jgi:hypothetical protein
MIEGTVWQNILRQALCLDSVIAHIILHFHMYNCSTMWLANLDMTPTAK